MADDNKIDPATDPFLQEWPDDKPIGPPSVNQIVQPFKELTQFYPNDQWHREDIQWVEALEKRFLVPFGEVVARIFRVDLIDDQDYISMPEETKAAVLSCVLTRSQIRETQTGYFEWYPVCVVVKYCVYAAIQVRVERSTLRHEVQKLLLWSGAEQQYVPIVDPQTGKIEDPKVLFPILEKYQQMEGLG